MSTKKIHDARNKPSACCMTPERFNQGGRENLGSHEWVLLECCGEQLKKAFTPAPESPRLSQTTKGGNRQERGWLQQKG